MSNRELGRTVRVRTVDDSTAIMLGVVRTIRSVGREITFLSRLMKILANDEIMAGVAAGDMAAMMQLAVPVIGVIAAGISIVAAARITQQRAAIPVGQTAPGQFRGVQATGTAIVHEGEIIGRPRMPSTPSTLTPPMIQPGGVGAGGGMGFVFNFFDSNLTTKRDVEDTVNEMYTEWYSQITRFKSS